MSSRRSTSPKPVIIRNRRNTTFEELPLLRGLSLLEIVERREQAVKERELIIERKEKEVTEREKAIIGIKKSIKKREESLRRREKNLGKFSRETT